MNAVIGGTIVVGACFVGINMLSDLLYKYRRSEGAMSMADAGRPRARGAARGEGRACAAGS